MIISVDITPDMEQAITEAAQRHGQTPEEEVSTVLKSVFVDRKLPAGSALTGDSRELFTETHFAAAAEATRPVWDTPEEDAAWAFLQAPVATGRP